MSDIETTAREVATAVLRCTAPSAEPTTAQVELIREALEAAMDEGVNGAMASYEAAEHP